MHQMNHHGTLLVRERVIHRGPLGERAVGRHDPDRVSAYGLCGPDVLVGCDGGVSVHRAGGGTEVLFQGPASVRFSNLAGADTTRLLAFSVGRQLFGVISSPSQTIREIGRFSGDVDAVAVAGRAPMVAAASEGEVAVYNLASRTPIFTFDVETAVRALSFCPMGYGLAALTTDDRVIVWSLLQNTRETFSVPSGMVDLSLDEDPPVVCLLTAQGEIFGPNHSCAA